MRGLVFFFFFFFFFFCNASSTRHSHLTNTFRSPDWFGAGLGGGSDSFDLLGDLELDTDALAEVAPADFEIENTVAVDTDADGAEDDKENPQAGEAGDADGKVRVRPCCVVFDGAFV